MDTSDVIYRGQLWRQSPNGHLVDLPERNAGHTQLVTQTLEKNVLLVIVTQQSFRIS